MMKLLLIAVVLLFIPFTSAIAECNQEEAFNKMMALGVAKGDIQKEMNALPSGPEKNQVMQRWAQIGQDISGVGKLLGTKEYGKACAEYDKIAQKYKVDLDELAKRAPTMKDLQKKQTG